MLSILVTILFSITCCSANSLLTGVAGFDGSTTDENLFYVLPSEEILFIGRIEVGENNSTFNSEIEINLTRHNCSLTKVFQLEDRFVAECQQNSLGGRLLLVISSISGANCRIEEVEVPVDDHGVRMNEGASWIYTRFNIHRWYIYARGGQLCSMEFAEGEPTCGNVDPDHCKHIFRISSDSISSINFTLACDSPTGKFTHFVVEYSTSDAKLTPFRLKYPSHEHRYFFVTKTQTVFVGVDSISIHDNHVKNKFIYCPVPGDGEIVSALMKESSLLYTIASKVSQSMTTSYSTYFLDLSTQQCDERKVGEDGCIIYILSSAYQWWLACPGEIRGYRHNSTEITLLPWPEGMSYDKHVTYTYPPVINLSTHPPTTSPSTATKETPTVSTTNSTGNSTSIVEGCQCDHSIIIVPIVVIIVLVIVYIISFVCTLVYMCLRQRKSRCDPYPISGRGTPVTQLPDHFEMNYPIVSDIERTVASSTGHVTNEPVGYNMDHSNIPSPRHSYLSSQESQCYTPIQSGPTGTIRAIYGPVSTTDTPDSVPRNSQSIQSGSPVHDPKPFPLPRQSSLCETSVDDSTVIPDQAPRQSTLPKTPDSIPQQNKPPETPELPHETGPLSFMQESDHQSTLPKPLSADSTVTQELESCQPTLSELPVVEPAVTTETEPHQSILSETLDFTPQQPRPLEIPETLSVTGPHSVMQDPETRQSPLPGTPDLTPQQSRTPKTSELELSETRPLFLMQDPEPFQSTLTESPIADPMNTPAPEPHLSTLTESSPHSSHYVNPVIIRREMSAPYSNGFQSHVSSQTDKPHQEPHTLNFQIQCPSKIVFNMAPQTDQLNPKPKEFSSDPLPFPTPDGDTSDYLPTLGGCPLDTEDQTMTPVSEVEVPCPGNTADTLEPRASLRDLNKPDGNSKPSPS